MAALSSHNVSAPAHKTTVNFQNFGNVFSWTSTVSQGEYLRKTLESTGVNCFIYGLKIAGYHNVTESRVAAKDILDWMKTHPNQRFNATNNNSPWYSSLVVRSRDLGRVGPTAPVLSSIFWILVRSKR
ncbi:MAG: hypothetical protein Q9171_001738 [Xanthocarpia ochracea]